MNSKGEDLIRELRRISNVGERGEPADPQLVPPVQLVEASQLARDASDLLLQDFARGRKPDACAVEVLVELALNDDPEISSLATGILFGRVVETVCDSFEVSDFYDCLMLVLLDVARRFPVLRDFDRKLVSLGCLGKVELAARRKGLIGRRVDEGKLIRKAIVLSRVTIGADVVVGSVIVQHLRHRFPGVEIVLVGSEKLRELFGGMAGLRVVPLKYGRGVGLMARLQSWMELLAILDEEWGEDCFVFDPDSRLTQLGFLPIGPQERDERGYLFFDGRRAGGSTQKSLSQLASEWMGGVLGVSREVVPVLSVPPDLVSEGSNVVRIVSSPVILVSLGVGGNERKRLSRKFEGRLLEMLSNRASVVLDCGGSEAELAEAEEHCRSLEKNGRRVVRLKEGEELSPKAPVFNGVLAWQGGIGSLAGIIGKCAGYVGYDSSGQHLAAALAVPLMVFFRNTGSELFAFRWKPCGRSEVLIVPSERLTLETFERSVDSFLRGIGC